MKLLVPQLMFLSFWIFLPSGSMSQSFTCDPEIITKGKHYNDLISDLPDKYLKALASKPTHQGALGRNRNQYFHVRFQLKMTLLSDLAVKLRNKEALDAWFRTVRYAFFYQKPTGDFLLNIPENIQGKNPTEGDLASGVAFFAYSLGLSINSLQTSEWFLYDADLQAHRIELKSYRKKLTIMLNYLYRSRKLLQETDSLAPNRLLFNAVAFYTLGEYLGNKDAKTEGCQFARKALSQTDAVNGYFREGGGWDSSYNGVALKVAIELLSVSQTEPELQSLLREKISCAMTWQVSRILHSGEISTEGNTRVFSGGEAFLGREKDVDVQKTLAALYYMSSLTGNDTYHLLAEKVLNYYL